MSLLRFESLGLSDGTLSAIAELGFHRATPVQAATIPLFLEKKDVAVEAVTGSGKTLAFVVPLVEMILRRESRLKSNQVGAIVVTSTRELAAQIFSVVSLFGRFLEEIKPLLLVGGTSIEDVLNSFKKKGASVLIGTPGRLDDMIKRRNIFDVRDLEVLILDEADTLLDLGFRSTLDSIFSLLPKQRRTGLFSATQTKEVKDLARAGLRNPATVSVAVRHAATNEVQATPSTLDNFLIYCDVENKLGLLVRFLQHQKDHKIIAFFSTCASVDFFSKVLAQLSPVRRQSTPVLCLHGRMVQKRRTAVFERFLELQAGVLICTDVAARGVDIPNVDWIVQYDPPTDPAFFVHRVGRTARAGRQGRSLTLLQPAEDAYAEFLALRKVPLRVVDAVADAVLLFGTTAVLAENKARDAGQDPGREVASPHDKPEEVLWDPYPEIKRMIKADRDLLEKGTRAFVSFIRDYKAHHCQFIFRFARLDLGAVARAFALLKLPKMPELVSVDFEEDDADVRVIKFKDKAREKVRQKKMEERRIDPQQRVRHDRIDTAHGALGASGTDTGQARRQERCQPPDEHIRKRKRGRHQQILDEWNELANEERLAKKLRKRQITKEEYEAALRAYDSDGCGSTSSDTERDARVGGRQGRSRKGQTNKVS